VMATYQEPSSGYLRFSPIGGLLQTTLMGSRVRFEDGTIGVIGPTRMRYARMIPLVDYVARTISDMFSQKTH